MTRITLAERLHTYERRSLGLLAAEGLVVVLMCAAVFVLWPASWGRGRGSPTGLRSGNFAPRPGRGFG
jgi:hypothetical protein